MNRGCLAMVFALVLAPLAGCQSGSGAGAGESAAPGGWAIALHGGAGVLSKVAPQEEREAYAKSLAEALALGVEMLKAGRSAMDTAEAVVMVLEDDPKFNAGRGAVFTAEGRNELDASIMDGATLKCGAVAGVTTVKNPIRLARRVMERTRHVILSREGAEEFASSLGPEIARVDPSYFFTTKRWKVLEEVLKERGEPMPALPRGVSLSAVDVGSTDLKVSGTSDKEGTDLKVSGTENTDLKVRGTSDKEGTDLKVSGTENTDLKVRGTESTDLKVSGTRVSGTYGTVGCVVLDSSGNLAAATSTGGMSGKRWARIGDSPIIGAGNYANNASCAVSGTGTGEEFIRHGVARDISSRMLYKGISVEQAAREVVHGVLKPDDGGVIAVSRTGEIAMVFNSEGMFRGAADSTGRFEVGIWEHPERLAAPPR